MNIFCCMWTAVGVLLVAAAEEGAIENETLIEQIYSVTTVQTIGNETLIEKIPLVTTVQTMTNFTTIDVIDNTTRVEEKLIPSVAIGNETLIEKIPLVTTESTMTNSTMTNVIDNITTAEENITFSGITVDDTLLQEESAFTEVDPMESIKFHGTNTNTRKEIAYSELELNVTLGKDHVFENISTIATLENSTTVPNVNDYSETQLNQFTVFMIQKQCNSNNSGREVFDKYSDLKSLVEEVDDCLYFAFIKVKAYSSSEIKEAMQKFEAKQFHVIKIKEKAGNQAKTQLILKEHLDCKECLGKDKVLESDLKEIKNEENITHGRNDISFYLVVVGSVLALFVVIVNIYLCYFRRKQGRSEIPSFSSKPEKFNMGPIPRPTILNGDNMAVNHCINGRPFNPLQKTEQFGERCHPRNENREAISQHRKKQAAPNVDQKRIPFTENLMFGAW